MRSGRISGTTIRAIAGLFRRLDYTKLARIYCYEGGDKFWKARRDPCRRLGIAIARKLLTRLKPGGRSLYVGAGVAELPALLVESLELQREVMPYNLRRAEVVSLNRACRDTPLRFQAKDAAKAPGTFDHLWIVSVMNDPERYPNLAPLSYGRADPVTFDPFSFQKERTIVQVTVNRCLSKLRLPALVTTSTEEAIWIAEWCHRKGIPYLVERRQYPTALVGDPICLIKIGRRHS